MLKRLWVWILVAIIAIGAVVAGVIWAVQANKNKNKVDGIYIAERLMEDEYAQGEDIAVRFVFQSDKEFTALKYVLDNGEEQEITMKKGVSKEKSGLDEKNGEYYASTGLLVIDASGLAQGTHLFKVYVQQDTVTTLTIDVVFTIVS